MGRRRILWGLVITVMIPPGVGNDGSRPDGRIAAAKQILITGRFRDRVAEFLMNK